MENLIIKSDFNIKNSNENLKLGGKAEKLLDLNSLGLNIPVWYGISSDFLNGVLKESLKFDEIKRLTSGLSDKSDENEIQQVTFKIASIIHGIEFPRFYINLLKKEHYLVFDEEDYFSVRSSAIGEDGEDISFAGIHESFLYVNGFESLLENIKKVWVSAFSRDALRFRINNNIPVDNIETGVVVQKMVNPLKSGVVFTVNPNNSNTNEIYISSLFGAGEGLVSRGFDADLYIILKDERSFSFNYGEKREKLVFDSLKKSGLKTENVDEGFIFESSLTKEELKSLTDISIKIEKHFKKPQDIEFAIGDDNEIYILQSRPVTTAKEYGPARGEKIVWDNSNIIESYSGPTSPMTISFIKHAYSIVYFCFSGVMGIPEKKIDENEEVFNNMLGFFNGRVYYNILNWYRLVKLFPGFSYNKKFMESMMGLQNIVDVEAEKEVGFFRKYFVELPSLIKLILKTASNFLGIEEKVKRFNDNFEENYQEWKDLDFSKQTPYQNMLTYQTMEKNLLWNWDVPIINDFYVMVYYGLLKNLCIKWCGDESGSLQNDLICGDGNIDSTKPTRLLLEIAEIVRADKKLHDFFMENSPKALSLKIPLMDEFQSINEKVDYYLEEYGFRCINELKLEEPSLHETPEFIYQCIKNYLEMDNLDSVNPDFIEKREKDIRLKAEKRVDKNLNSGVMGKIKKFIFKRVLNNARRGVRNRENMRFARTKIYGILRNLLNGTGKYFVKEGILKDSQDIYYLKIDELWDYVKGTAVDYNLSSLTEFRKSEYRTYYNEEDNIPDDHFETYGLPYHKNLRKNFKKPAEKDFNGDLKGTGCSPGQLTEKIKIVKSPRDDLKLNKEILVAERTDPGWVPLYPSVSGVLIERGSILSHSAIVAREMGIPTIVGIPDLIEKLKDVEKVSMDGTTGIVNIEF
jgi:phosphohistidine swiveling domain-containing protein